MMRSTLNSAISWTFGQDAIGALLHESDRGHGQAWQSRCVFQQWFMGAARPLSVRRAGASPDRPAPNTADATAAHFSFDGVHLSSLTFHRLARAPGRYDGSKIWGIGTADPGAIPADAFGPTIVNSLTDAAICRD